MDIKNIFCPLTKSKIDEYSCYLISEAAEGNIPENEMPGKQDFKKEQEICMNCSHHDID